MDPVVLATFRDPWAYIAVTAVMLIAGGIRLLVRALTTGTLRTDREVAALEGRLKDADTALRIRDEQVNAALAVLPQVAEVLEKIHEARPKGDA